MIGVEAFSIDIFFHRFVELVKAPYTYPVMLWIAIPLLLTMLLVELYFGRYKYEELGWNTAFGNSLVLIFVAADLFRRLYTTGNFGYLDFKNLLVLAVAFEGITLTMVSYFHLLPKNFAFGVYAKLPINLIAYISVILVYAIIPISWITVICAILLILALMLVVSLIKAIIPGVVELEREEVEEYEKAPEA